MVKQALEVLGFHKQADQLQHVSYGVVSLSPSTAEELGIDTSAGKASYAMSGRQGIGIKVADMVVLMEQIIEAKRARKTGISSKAIAIAAIRYYLLRYNLQTEIVFDLHKATEISGNTGVYLLYAYARAASIIAKVEKELVTIPGPRFDFAQELEPAETALMRMLASWADVLAAAAKERAPHQLANYAFELATTFNAFYAACPILKADVELRGFRIALTVHYKATLGEALKLLGLPTPSRM